MSVPLRLTYQHICQGNEKVIYNQLNIHCLSCGTFLKWLENLGSYSKTSSCLTCQLQQKYSLWTVLFALHSRHLVNRLFFFHNLCLWFSNFSDTGTNLVTDGLFWNRAMGSPRCVVTEIHHFVRSFQKPVPQSILRCLLH